MQTVNRSATMLFVISGLSGTELGTELLASALTNDTMSSSDEQLRGT
jgi:hypothetical protein